MEKSWLTELYSIKDIFNQIGLIEIKFSLLSSSLSSKDFDGCIKLINKKKEIITFFEISAINVKIKFRN